MRNILVVALVVCLASVCMAQAPAPHLSGFKLLEWERDVAASAFALKPTERNRADLVSAQEKLSAAVCMPKYFENLTFDGNPTDQKCRAHLDKLFELDKLNPIGICIRDGVRTPACASAFSGQIVETFSVYGAGSALPQEDRSTLGLAFKLEQDRAAPNIAKYWNELSSQEAGAAGKSPEEIKEFRTKTLKPLYAKLLKESCRISRLSFESRPAGAPQTVINLGPTPTPGADENAKRILERLEHAYKKPTAVPAKDASKVVRRVRYISDACKRAAEAVRARNPQDALAVCMVHGPYSSHCLVALSYERQAAETEQKGSKSTNKLPASGAHGKAETQGLEEF